MENDRESENNNTRKTDKVPQMQILNDSPSIQSSNQATATTSSTPANITKDGKKRIRPNFLIRENACIGNKRRKETVLLDSNTGSTLPNKRPTLSAAGGKVNVRLSSHKVKEFLLSKNLSEYKKDLKVECHNDRQGLSRIVCSLNKVNLWSDVVPNAVTLIAGNDKYVVIGCENGSIIIYDHSGLRLLLNIVLDSAASHLLISREYLLCLSQTGIINVWKLPKLESIVSSVSIVPIIQPSSTSLADLHYASIEKIFIRPRGVPILMTDTNEAWCYHLSAKTWVQIYDPRYSSKEKMKTTTEEYGGDDTRGILNTIEKIARDRGDNYGTLSYLAQGESKLGHLYNQLLSAELVSSPNEYKEILLSYAKALADVGNATNRSLQQLIQEYTLALDRITNEN
ncbi:16406_t:CDS:2 [Entrophospora sp. SA101]|nr:16406_t:CDS:2 [Entrophospora sp. SA101]